MMHNTVSNWLMRRNSCCRSILVLFRILIQVVTCLPILVCNVQVLIAEISSCKLYYNQLLKLVLVLYSNNQYSKRSRHLTILISNMKSQWRSMANILTLRILYSQWQLMFTLSRWLTGKLQVFNSVSSWWCYDLVEVFLYD